MDTVVLRDLTYHYPETPTAALASVSLAIRDGITLVTGPSGGGKSTLLRLCNGLVPHFTGGSIAGAAYVLGHDVITTPTRVLARDVGFVFQDPELQGVYATVERDVAFGLENAGMPRALMVQHVDEALLRTGTEHLRQRALSTLSGGERQRVALAGALAQRPRLLVLDEPLSQLDADGAAEVLDALATISRLGTTVLIAEHRLEQVRPVCDDLLRVEAGCVSRDGAIRIDHAEFAMPAAPSGAAAWRLQDVTVGISGSALLHDVSLEGGGDVVSLMGANGSGKTTLLRVLAGLLPAMAGTVTRPRGRIAYLPQNPAAMLHRSSVREELRWTLRHQPHDAGEVDAMLGMFELRSVADRYPRDLSSGQRQRVAIAAVMVGSPALVLLDEPTRGMDDAARAALCHAIARAIERGAAVVMATHDETLAAATGGRTVVLRDGVVRERFAHAEAVST